MIHDKECYKFFVGRGNNSKVVRDAMLGREWWEEVPQGFSTLYNFKWMPVSQQFNFNALQSRTVRSLINHLENHHEITRKSSLFANLLHWSESTHSTQMVGAPAGAAGGGGGQSTAPLVPRRDHIFKIVPITFSLSLDGARLANPDYLNQALAPFLSLYQILEENKHKVKAADGGPGGEGAPDPTGHHASPPARASLNNSFSAAPRYLQPRAQPSFTLPLSHFVGHNLWILKPTSFNRGQGIHVFRDLDKLRELLVSYMRGQKPAAKRQLRKTGGGSTTSILSEIAEERGGGGGGGEGGGGEEAARAKQSG